MVACSSCCEWYHAWCAEEWSGCASGGWQCARCVACAACSRAAARLRCRACARHYHAACLPHAPPSHRSDWPQVMCGVIQGHVYVYASGGWQSARCVAVNGAAVDPCRQIARTETPCCPPHCACQRVGMWLLFCEALSRDLDNFESD